MTRPTPGATADNPLRITVRGSHDWTLEATIDAAVAAARDELVAATGKFGSFASAHEGYAVILEELDELWAEVRNDKAPGARARQRREATQVAAMALRFLVDLPDGPDADEADAIERADLDERAALEGDALRHSHDPVTS